MPSLTEHPISKITKLLLIGDSGSGKTGSMASLALAGYKLRILDMDNGLDSLAAAIRQKDPKALANVDYITLRDQYEASELGPRIKGQPKAFTAALRALDNWPGLGKPADFGPEAIVVIDSLTFLGDAAYAWAEPLVASKSKGGVDNRQIYGMAQGAIEQVLAQLTDSNFNANVIVTAHIRYQEMPDGSKRGYPTSIGQALGPTIPRYFNSTALFQSNSSGQRSLQTVSNGLIDLKNPASFKMARSFPIETGLADFFKTIRGG